MQLPQQVRSQVQLGNEGLLYPSGFKSLADDPVNIVHRFRKAFAIITVYYRAGTFTESNNYQVTCGTFGQLRMKDG